VGTQQDWLPEEVYDEVYKGSRFIGWVIPNALILSSLFTHLTSHSPLLTMAAVESHHQFETDPITGQIFYREPIEGFYPPPTALELLDCRLPPPASYNVRFSFLRLPSPNM
jgi:hypothetical protein